MSVCPQCARSFPVDQRFCTTDGTPLPLLDESDPALGDTHHFDRRKPVGAAGLGPLAPGSLVGEYVIEEQIGEGGMGVIFRGVHPIIGKHAAIKVLSGQLASDEDMVARFIQEAKSVNRIRHRHIVDIFGFGVLPDGRHYFAMELLDGESLAARLARGRLPIGELLELMLEGASALEAAHNVGIVHRDLKPDNLFLCASPDGSYLKVLDFGIAKLMGDSAAELAKTAIGVPIGTPLYMSPEQAAGEPHVDHRSDLYSFGVVLYECLAGHPPFRGQTVVQVLNSHLSEPPPPLATLVDVPPALEALVVQLLAKRPAERPADMKEVRLQLKALHERLGSLPEARAASPRARRRRSGALAVALGVVAAAGLGTSWWAMRSRPSRPAPSPAKETAPVALPSSPPPSPSPSMTGYVRVTTNVLATRLYLDEKSPEGAILRGAAPAAAGGASLKVAVPVAGNYVLRVEADGYEPVLLPLKVNGGEESAIPVLLVRSSGKAAKPGKAPHAEPAPAEPPKRRVNENLMNPW